MDEEHGAEGEADDDRLGEVAEEGEAEGDEEHRRVAPGGAEQRADRRLFDHVPGDDGEHRGERGERDVGGERRGDEHEDQQEQPRARMPATGPCAPARTLVAVRAMVPVTQKPPKRPEATLATPWAISSVLRAVAAAGHAVGDHRGEQRLDRAEQREAEGVGQHRDDLAPARASGRVGAGKPAGMPPKALPMVATVEAERPGGDGGDGDDDQHPRPVRPPAAERDEAARSQPAESATVGGLSVGSARPERRQLLRAAARAPARRG